MYTTRLKVPIKAIARAVERAGLCRSQKARERVLISQAAAFTIREYLAGVEKLKSTEGRSSKPNFIEFLDLCDFRVGNSSIEVRTITGAPELGLYAPTVPIMVGVISDYYLGAQITPNLTDLEVFGYATAADLADARLSANGLFAFLPTDTLRPFESLPDVIRHLPVIDRSEQQRYQEWLTRANRVVKRATKILAVDGNFDSDQVERLAGKLHDEILLLYGERIERNGIEPLLERLLRQFGMETPIRVAPGQQLSFINRSGERAKMSHLRERLGYFRGELQVAERVSLYRHLIEDESAFETQRQMNRILDEATVGHINSSDRRRRRLRESRAARIRRESNGPPEVERYRTTDTSADEVRCAAELAAEYIGQQPPVREDQKTTTDSAGIVDKEEGPPLRR